MIKLLLKYLRSEGGYISAAMAIGSTIFNMVQGQRQQSKLNKLFHKTGEEENLQGYTTNLLTQGIPSEMEQRTAGREGLLDPALAAANRGGLMDAIAESFSQRPNSAEMDAIARQELNLKNKALNTGARGGLLRQQMFEAAKNAASNKLNITENARQNALQRAFQIFNQAAPSQASDVARGNQVLGYNQIASGALRQLAEQGMQRNLGQAGVAAKSAQGSGEGAGGGLGSILGGLGNLFPSLQGPVSGAVGGTPSFSLPGAGQGFAQVPFMQGFGG